MLTRNLKLFLKGFLIDEKMLDLFSLIMFAFSGKLSSPNDVTVLLKLLLTYWTIVPWLPDLSVGQIQVEQCPPCGAVLTPTARPGFSSTKFLIPEMQYGMHGELATARTTV